ncbi:MAG: methionyl-tRNA formyltransferase [Pseudomonadota bacterium]|nr:methionyl-tRNA formyltransferase [Pseudomonadota bacterium]MDP1903850.1 methionyl-tRNA formyltransferase [Pseudomonadota bacterium]MDP2353652.1 methionyl-tRNA formyltransferase [Pseudomonadota bacterium]
MRLIFAGTPEFAAAALRALIAAGHEIPLVLTQPDRPAGRGMKLKASPVKEVALAHGLTVAQPENLKTEAARQPIADAAADAMVVAAYGLILPEAALGMPRLGCVNIHASLLPRWRGAAPIHRAIEAGDAETGITLMQMDKGLDTGAMLTRAALPILADDTTGSLHDKLAALGAREIVALLPRLETMLGEQQDDALASYAKKITKDDARLDWNRSAVELDRQIRAFNPFPGAHALFGGETIKLWQARPVDASGQPGAVLAVNKDALRIACGTGALDITEAQKPGGKRLPIAAFLAGSTIKPGDLLM